MARIALVDDDSSIRRSVSRLLRSLGHECAAYDSAESALADPCLLQAVCLLIDIELFGMNGFELRDHLRDLGSSVPHIFVTAHSEADIPDWNARMGDSSWLVKPVDEDVLRATIEKLTLKTDRLPAA